MPEPLAENAFPRGRAWAARWIWAPGTPPRNAYAYFRANLPLSPPPRATLHITADTRYELYVNGQFAGRGPVQSQPYWTYYDSRDVSPLLRDGPNVIAVLVNHVGHLPHTRPGLLAEMTDADGRTLLVTDGAWRCAAAHAWNADAHFVPSQKVAPFQEHYDARLAPQGWTLPEFDDADWHRPHVLSTRGSHRAPQVAPWSCLLPRDIPDMEHADLFATHVTCTEECLDIENRPTRNNLAPRLSAVGRPLKAARLEHPHALLAADGTTVARSSPESAVYDTGGLYDPCVVLDFGRVVTARPCLDVDGPAGAAVEIGYAERLVDGRFNNALECEFADRYTLRDGHQQWRTSAWRAFRFLKLRFTRCRRPLTVHAVRAERSRYPFHERGAFAADDDVLDGVFRISRRTLRLCCHDGIFDTPFREAAQWLGDVAAVTLGGIYACFGDTALPGKFLRQSAANLQPTGLIANMTNAVSDAWENTIPDYSLWWLMGLWQHYLYTGDLRYVTELYPQTIRIIQTHLRHVDRHGLLTDVPYWLFIDWADLTKAGTSAAANAVFGGALQAMVNLAGAYGDARMQDACRDAVELLRRNFVPRLFDEARGLFADARVDGRLTDKVSEHGNVAAIRWGLCDESTARDVVRRLFEQPEHPFVECQPFFTKVTLEALERVGRRDLALALIRDRWGRRMLARGATTCYEEWSDSGSFRGGPWHGFLRTHSHAWSAAPAEWLIRGLAGLRLLEPGCRKIRLDPAETPFDYDVAYPTPQGLVRVRRTAGDTAVQTPPGVHVVP